LVSQLLVEFFLPIQYTGTLYYILTMKLLLPILLTTSLFAQKEYNIKNIYERASDKVYIKKFSDEVVNGSVYKMFGDQKVVLGKMVKGKREGVWTQWYDNGVMGAKSTYVNGLENGKSSAFYDNGALKTEGYLKNGEIVGTVTQYYKNGKINAIQKRTSDGIIFYQMDFDENGNLKAFNETDSLSLDGKITFYNLNKSISQVNYYKAGIRDGTDTTFLDTYTNTIITQEWVNGKKNGYKRVFMNGKLGDWERYVNDKKVESFISQDSINFVEDSTFIHKIADDGIKGYTTAFFNFAYGDIVYRTASRSDTLKQLPNLKGYKVFPYIRKNGSNEYLLITNANNESIGYIEKSRISFSNRNHIEEFDRDIRQVRFKYILD
jgi:antitoxin component YwqK of YwqJK toxin-antitoxin module